MDLEEKIIQVEKKVIAIETSVNNINNTSKDVHSLLLSIDKKQTENPLSIGLTLGTFLSLLTIFTLLFSGVVYISNNSIAPLKIRMESFITFIDLAPIKEKTYENESRLNRIAEERMNK